MLQNELFISFLSSYIFLTAKCRVDDEENSNGNKL